MKTINELTNELIELQAILTAISWIESRRPNIDLDFERKITTNKRNELLRELGTRG